jgi:hypothetical protein
MAFNFDLIIHNQLIEEDFKPFKPKKSRSGQKFGYSGRDRLSPANLPENPLLSW